jgi:hypothetical protein
MAKTGLFMPVPSAAHVLPFHRAMLLTVIPPAVVKVPPATKSPLGITVSVSTSPFIPVPSADQVLPFHRAILLTVTPPAVVNLPPATKSPVGRTERDLTRSPIPVPSADQVLPFHRAMLLTVTPPAVVKPPPATKSPLGRTLMAQTELFMPVPSADQDHSHWACVRAVINIRMPTTSVTMRIVHLRGAFRFDVNLFDIDWMSNVILFHLLGIKQPNPSVFRFKGPRP